MILYDESVYSYQGLNKASRQNIYQAHLSQQAALTKRYTEFVQQDSCFHQDVVELIKNVQKRGFPHIFKNHFPYFFNNFSKLHEK